MTHRIINPESLGAPKGWNHGILAEGGGRILFVAGQIGCDETGNVVSGEFVDQFARALENILAVVKRAGGGPRDVGRLTIYVSSIDTYLASLKPLGTAYRGVMGPNYPAMALVEVTRLVDESAQVEIEATAVIPEQAGPE